MRKVLGVMLAVGLLAPAVVFTAAPAGAAAGVTCTKASGTFKFTPPLPITGTIKGGKLTSTGTISGCSGGGVTSGKTSFVSAPSKTPAGCKTLLAPDPKSKGTLGTLTIKWNNGKTSISKNLYIKQTKAIVDATTKGTVTSGTAFKGKAINGTITFKINSGACTTKPASGGTYTQKKGTKFTVK
jgi:hypothetical protein